MFQRSELNHQHAFISRRPNISPSIPSSSGNKYLSLSRDFLVSIMISVDTRSRGKRPCMNVRHSSKNRLFYLHAVSHTRRMSQTIFFSHCLRLPNQKNISLHGIVSVLMALLCTVAWFGLSGFTAPRRADTRTSAAIKPWLHHLQYPSDYDNMPAQASKAFCLRSRMSQLFAPAHS